MCGGCCLRLLSNDDVQTISSDTVSQLAGGLTADGLITENQPLVVLNTKEVCKMTMV